MSDYDRAREDLRAAELALMLQREEVAAMRRDLPPGPVVHDYEFSTVDGPVRLSELFSRPDRSLILYHFMYGKAQTAPCPMCSMWADGWNAVSHHIGQNVDMALVTAAPADDTAKLAADRGWGSLRWLSGAHNSFKSDFGSEDEQGNQQPFITVFELDDDRPRLSYAGGAHIEGDHWRGVDLLSPVWHLLDLTRAGRGNWMPSLSY